MSTIKFVGLIRNIKRTINSPVFWVFAITLSVLSVYPIPECVACEFARPWGRNDVAYEHASVVYDVWLVSASMISGIISLRKYWLIPFLIVLADMITQPIGGVALWSLFSNEGPMIIGLGGAVGGCSLIMGSVIRLIYNYLSGLCADSNNK